MAVSSSTPAALLAARPIHPALGHVPPRIPTSCPQYPTGSHRCHRPHTPPDPNAHQLRGRYVMFLLFSVTVGSVRMLRVVSFLSLERMPSTCLGSVAVVVKAAWICW